jgi:hypothetical protein
MDPDLQSMLSVLGQVEIALVSSAARLNGSYFEIAFRCSRDIAAMGLGLVDRASPAVGPAPERYPDAVTNYCRYLREFAGANRFAVMSFLYALQQSPRAPAIHGREETPRRQGGEMPEAARIREEPYRLVRVPMQHAPEGPASKNFLLY